jgi:hypothetical protein
MRDLTTLDIKELEELLDDYVVDYNTELTKCVLADTFRVDTETSRNTLASYQKKIALIAVELRNRYTEGGLDVPENLKKILENNSLTSV